MDGIVPAAFMVIIALIAASGSCLLFSSLRAFGKKSVVSSFTFYFSFGTSCILVLLVIFAFAARSTGIGWGPFWIAAGLFVWSSSVTLILLRKSGGWAD